MPFTEADLAQLESLLDKKLAPIQESIDFFAAKYDKLLKQFEQQETKIRELSSENVLLKSQVSNLQNEAIQLKESVNEMEQYSRRECLEIKGIPVDIGENTNELVAQLGSLIDVDIDPKDISVSHRIPSRNRRNGPPSIIVKFIRRDLRDQLYQARKKLKDFTTRNLNLGHIGDNKIFISESLTSKNKELFNNALKVKKDFNFKFIWTKYGHIYLRKNNESPVRRISSYTDLEMLKGLQGGFPLTSHSPSPHSSQNFSSS